MIEKKTGRESVVMTQMRFFDLSDRYASLDASIVPVPRNHNTRDKNAAIKKGEVPEGWTDKPAKRVQKDVDAPSPDIAAQRTADWQASR
ncbi:hypothetical protein OAN307_c23440 [Octadecabacter antarcticus 307]|uniref:Uncharacterized protein n=1 Tax=Octadecabacter antarcticus 307 TaxID=391626 RepID=M9RDV3_9RHOB|nr:hypothetical protein OAN307_c23440 [Octadecabacter antarcticus 307]